MQSTIVSFLEHGSRHELQAALGKDVVFHSPVRDYRGQAEVAHILSTIRTVLDAITRNASSPAIVRRSR